MKTHSVLIALPGNSQVRVIVPAFEPAEAAPIREAIEVVKAFAGVPSDQWIARILETNEVTDVELK